MDYDEAIEPKEKKVSDLDNYRIVHHTNMITYQERLKQYKQKNKSEAHSMILPQRFKRRQLTPPPTAPSSNTNTPNQKMTTLTKIKNTNVILVR